MHSNVVCFTSYRLANTTPRGNRHGKAKVNGLINTLHNLRLQYDRHKGVKGIPKRSYYLHAPKYAGGLDTRGRTPTHINLLVERLRDESKPATVLGLTTIAKVDKP
jgi:hypothetical protein